MGDGVDVGGSGRGGGGGDGDGVERVVVGNAQAVSLGHLLGIACTYGMCLKSITFLDIISDVILSVELS